MRVWLGASTLAVLLGCAGAGETSRDPAVASQAPAGQADSPRDEGPPSEGATEADDRQPLEVLRGRASYYSDSLAGNRTASGDVYDPEELTAASRDLPFGTVVRVVREDTGAAVEVRVNDRGPFNDESRILDLSRAAAERLDMIEAGVVEIRAEILERPED